MTQPETATVGATDADDSTVTQAGVNPAPTPLAAPVGPLPHVLPVRDRAARLREIIDTNAWVDLHAHTNNSDGAWTPADLVRDGLKEGLSMLAITDHDTVAGAVPFELAAYRAGLLPLVGCEVTITHEGKNYHMLSFDVDPGADVWERISAGRNQRRLAYFDEMFGRLRAQGLNVTLQMGLDANGNLLPSATSAALIAGGNCKTEDEARGLLKRVKLDYPIHMLAITARDFADWLPAGGAICSVAHAMREEPGTSNRVSDAHVEAFKEMLPLVALEVRHPYHKPDEVEAARAMAARHKLAVTSGSDAHGYNVKRPPRPYAAAESRAFLDLLLARWSAAPTAPQAISGVVSL